MKKIQKKIIICSRDNVNFKSKVEKLISARVFGAVFITNSSLEEFYIRSSFPVAFLSIQDGENILRYVKQSKNPTVSFGFQKTSVGTKPAPKVDSYSSRGPYLSCPNVLKLDILAPGMLILGSWSPYNSVTKIHFNPIRSKFNHVSGTSMAAPHIAGMAALIKRAHLDRSPAAIRSAIMTTANTLDNTLRPIKNTAHYNLPATSSPLDMGAGHVNPNKAIDPGLIYDTTVDDYINLLCAMNYTTSQMKTITRSVQKCDNNHALDLNYPSFIVFFNNEDETGTREFQRTVTNVGERGFSYRAKLTGMDGVKVKVEPERLVFERKYEKQSYKVILEGPELLNQEVVHGSLVWVDDDDERYLVRSPIVVTGIVAESLRA